MATVELREITRSISAEMGGVVGNLRKTANDNQKMFSSILKDMGAHFEAQSRGMDDVSSTVEETSNRVASKVDSTNNLLQDQIGVLSNLYAEMKNLNGSVTLLNRNINNNNSSLLTGLLGGLRGLQNVIIGTAMSAAPAMLGLAGGIGGGLMSDIMGGKGAGGVGQKISNPVMAKDIYSYLKDKGVDHEHAVGILANIQNESQFNSGAIGDNGTSGGLFQHHNERFTAMKKAAGPDWQKNWKGQVDYALSEGDMHAYLKRPVRSGEEAARAFVYDFERPLDKPGEANKRAANVGNVEKLVAGGVQQSPKTASSATTTTAASSTSAATPVDKPAATEVGHTGAEHAGHAHEGIISGKPKTEDMSPNSAKEFLQSRGGAQSGAVGVNADRLDSDFAEKMAKAIKAAEQATGSKVTITEGYRDPHVQAQYYSDYIGKPIIYDGKTYQPNPAKLGRLAAPPGRSKHQKGMAVDIGDGPAREWLIQNAPKFGIESLFAKIGKDKPHFQMPGAGGEEGQGPSLQEATFPQGAGISSISPGAGSSEERLAQIQQNIQSLGGGVEGGEGGSQTPMMGMGIPAHGMIGAVGINQAIEAARAFSAEMSGTMNAVPPAPPVASMITETPQSSSQVIEQSQIQNQVEEYSSRETLKAYAEQTSKQTTEIAASEASSGTPVMHDYNNVNDVGWPDWAAIVGGNHWQELKKVKLNMFG